MLSAIQKPELVTDSASEPVSATEAKKQLELSGSDHDTQIALLIQAAREQWEHDTQTVMVEQTWRQRLESFGEFQFVPGPATAVTSVTYYDTANASQTLSSDYYDIDLSRNAFVLKADYDWPGTYTRWDAVTVNYTVGVSSVPAIAKQAILLLVGYYFENRDMLMSDAMSHMRAYESLVRRFMRSSYP